MKEKFILCVFKTNCSKNNVKPAHWVGHLQLRSLDTDYFFKRTPVVDEKQASVTVNTVKLSVSGGGAGNPFLLQEEEETVAEDTNDYADVNAEANEINDKKKYMVVKIEEENKTLGYQETMNVDIENIASKNQPFWRPIYEVIDDSYFGLVNLFQKYF